MARKIGTTWQRLIAVALFIAMLAFPWAGTAMAQTASNAQASVNAAPGVVHYSAKQALPDGGTNYVFNIDGVQNILHEPPDGFCPATATDAQLAEYGFPARPKDATALAAWTSKWSRFKTKRGASDPVITLLPSAESSNTVSPAVNPPSHVGGNQTWSGYGDYVLGENAFQAVSGDYTQPTYGASSPSGAEECSWVGLGGYFESPLLRVGSEMDGPSTYYAWYGYSNASNSYKYEVSGAVNPGDDISLQAFWVPNSNYPAAFVFWDWNTMTNFYITAQVTSAYYDGSSAEFIDGRPSSSVPLADYTSNNWTECEVWNESGTGQPGTDFTTIPYLEFVMSDASGNELSYPNLPSLSNSFTNKWYLSQ